MNTNTLSRRAMQIALAVGLAAPLALFAAGNATHQPGMAQAANVPANAMPGYQGQMQGRMQTMQARMQAMQSITDPQARMPLMQAQMKDMQEVQAMMKEANAGCPMADGKGGVGQMGGAQGGMMMGGGMAAGVGKGGAMPMPNMPATPAK
ncbi:MAG: hypothetical protein KKF85_14660 [Gammaproteobacteria bacterium]|nr:hypothetical protein [Rhodocyclaceae bacterium]MBU3909686.1 hypothetical protein [Gammaproteobacteria bacterium]MBU3988036.1 hypothetical protein [Gammaproteobacteria bacterium]MBU4005219.1 hypothetical protein [Gammaproteobacteria bacterium]MBU4022398.1 hypothetical protein [Gammaproteobacteria bacterium]